MQHVPTLLAVSMAMAMRQYYTMRITQWRRFMAFIKATKLIVAFDLSTQLVALMS
jgi:hypothetical protein